MVPNLIQKIAIFRFTSLIGFFQYFPSQNFDSQIKLRHAEVHLPPPPPFHKLKRAILSFTHKFDHHTLPVEGVCLIFILDSLRGCPDAEVNKVQHSTDLFFKFWYSYTFAWKWNWEKLFVTNQTVSKVPSQNYFSFAGT